MPFVVRVAESAYCPIIRGQGGISMPRITANRPYGLLAKYYDQLFTFHLSWYEAARQRVLGGVLLHLQSACDLACGTGTTALVLARKGIKMYGVDLSPTMCRLAREKSRRLGLPLASSKSACRTTGGCTPSDWSSDAKLAARPDSFVVSSLAPRCTSMYYLRARCGPSRSRAARRDFGSVSP